jgi:hypothetical protein
LLRFLLAQESLREPLCEGPVIELRASADDDQSSLLPASAVVEINAGDAAEANRAVRQLKGELGVLLIHNALQLLIETREFLGLCFAKLAVGGLLIVIVPHQFLYERKLRLPSRRNPLHRRFYTPNTLLADIEEAIDPCECRVRFLADHDGNYDYRAELSRAPEGAQNVVVALEKIARPPWRPELDQDEIWSELPTKSVRYLELNKKAPAIIRTIAPDAHGINRIIVLKLDHRGDFLMANEAFRLLRNSFESAEITLVCGPWNVAEAQSYGLFEKIVPFDYFPEDDSARLQRLAPEVLIEEFAKQISATQYDLAIDLRLHDDTRDVLHVIKARNRAGFDRYDRFPWLTIRLNIPSATDDDRAERGVITAEHFSTAVCRHLGYEIRAEAPQRLERWQSIIWGPYHDLKPGRYQFECLIEPQGEGFEAPFDIVANSGKEAVHAGVLKVFREQYPQMYIPIDRKLEKFEFRLIGVANYELKPFRFFGLRFVRPSVIRGVHQSEAMVLLAQLIQTRLRNPYTTDLV